MAGSSPSAANRYLLFAGLGMVGALYGLVAILGGGTPDFKAGYHVPEEPVEVEVQRPTLTEERRRILEAYLSPAPVLVWSEEAGKLNLPSGLVNPEIILSFKQPELDQVIPEETAQAAVAPPPSLAESPAPGVKLELPETLDGEPVQIKPVYLKSLPDIVDLPAAQRKKQFIAFMLPLILRANQELADRRNLVLAALEAGDMKRLRQWGELYGFTPNDPSLELMRDELLKRVAPVPVSIALAQAAVESGWGTSRFARQGNALFGQWAWTKSAGIRPLESRFDNAVVRSFATLFDSVRAYMHNLNTHQAYAGFRDHRAGMVDDFSPAHIKTLAATLDQYSEEGAEYVRKLLMIINVNDLLLYDTAQLSKE